jgi:hypothetical protein
MRSTSRFGTIEQVAADEPDDPEVVLRGVIAAVRRARNMGLTTSRLFAALEPIPGGTLARLRSWVLAEATDISNDVRIAEIAQAIGNRRPTGDDVRLIQLILDSASEDPQLGPWGTALGIPPIPDEIGRALALHEIPSEWQRASLWHPLLPDKQRNAWDMAVALIAPSYPVPTQADYLEPPAGFVLEPIQSPMTSSELEVLNVDDAARKISSWRPVAGQLTLTRELARVLEGLVSTHPREWAVRPLQTLALLRHATYVHHYFVGLAKTSGDLADLASQLVEAIGFARTHPWDIVRLGNDDFDYDPTWAPADEAGITLLGRLAERDIDLGDRYAEAWRIVLEAARDRSSESSLSGREDPLERAINRPCTRALEAMFHLLGTELRRRATLREEALDLLDEALMLEGRIGAEHRAIIAPRIGFLLQVAPEWVKSRESRLFGSAAPDRLAQISVDMALKWGRPNGWVLQRHRRRVLHAMRESIPNALDQVLVAMMWNVPGYSIEETLRYLVPVRAGAAVVSDAGESLARLLMHNQDREHLDRGVGFWQHALDQALPDEAYGGFGWWAEVDGIERARWESMMLATCERANGSLDWAVKTAERSIREPISAEGLAIVTKLLRGRHEPWDRSRVAEIGLTALKTTGSEPNLIGPRDRLRAALTDLGYFEAADL